MDDKRFEAKMAKLKQSYEHLPTKSSTDSIMAEIKKNEKPIKKRSLLHLPYVASFIGILLIGGLLGAQLISQNASKSGENQQPTEKIDNQPVTESQIETAINEIRGYYERKVDELKEELPNVDVEQYGFVQEAKQAVEKFEERKNYHSQSELATYRDKVREIIDFRVSMPEAEYDLLIEEQKKVGSINTTQLLSYTDKLDRLKDNPFGEWLTLFNENAQRYAMTDIDEYLNKLNQGESIEGITEYKQLTEIIKKSGYYFYHEGEGSISFQPNYQEIYDQFSGSLQEEAELYLKIKSHREALMDGGFTITHKELGERLLELEKLIVNYPTFPNMEEFKAQYQLFIHYYLKGIFNTEIVTADGRVKKEVRNNFEALIKENEFSETAKIVANFYQKLSDNDYLLTEQLENEIVELPSILMPIVEVTSSQKYLLPISASLERRYQDLSTNGVMEYVDTIEIARLFMSAVEREDYETAYKLTYKGEDGALSKETFITEMRQADLDFQALSNEVTRVGTYDDYDSNQIKLYLIKNNGEIVTFSMWYEMDYPKVDYKKILQAN